MQTVNINATHLAVADVSLKQGSNVENLPSNLPPKDDGVNQAQQDLQQLQQQQQQQQQELQNDAPFTSATAPVSLAAYAAAAAAVAAYSAAGNGVDSQQIAILHQV